MDKTKIDWATASWNPITGCLHGCEYCYAREMAKRFCTRKNAYWDRDQGCINHWNGVNMPVLSSPIMFMAEAEDGGVCGGGCDAYPIAVNPYPVGFTPTFHRYHLDKPQHWKKPRNIFVVSMGDMFGDWVPLSWIKDVYSACEVAPWHNYMFLTKNPAKIHNWDKFYGWKIVEQAHHIKNAWFGFSVTQQKDLEKLAMDARALPQNTFISIEPIHGPINLQRIQPVDVDAYLDFLNGGQYWFMGGDKGGKKVRWIIIGAESGNGKDKAIPRREWVADIVDQCRAAGVPVFLKGSLAGIWGEPLIQEYPQELLANAHSGQNEQNERA